MDWIAFKHGNTVTNWNVQVKLSADEQLNSFIDCLRKKEFQPKFSKTKCMTVTTR